MKIPKILTLTSVGFVAGICELANTLPVGLKGSRFTDVSDILVGYSEENLYKFCVILLREKFN